MDEDDYHLSQLLLSAVSPSALSECPSSSPDPKALPQVQRRPISKRRGKKRSSRACGSCRARKVRCNIVAHGAPCSNCRHDEVDCFLPLSRRQKSARERMEREERERKLRMPNFTTDPQDCVDRLQFKPASTRANQNFRKVRNPTLAQSQSASETQLGPHGMAISEPPLSEVLPTSIINPAQPGASRTKRPRPNSWMQMASPLASAPTPLASLSGLPRLPSIFAAFPRHVSAHDLSYLDSRGALTLPPKSLQIASLKAYAECVHPSFPILDLEEFLSVVKCELAGLEGESGQHDEQEVGREKKICFLLFQAVMFAAVDFVSLKFLKEAGYKSRENARAALFARVRLLYDFDTSIDRLSIIQSLLLMTLSPPPLKLPQDTKDAWHWLGLAISLSYSLGLNRADGVRTSDPRRERLERRVWWTIFTRDRSLAFGSDGERGRPMRIKRVDCDIEMLSLEDFDFRDWDDDDDELEDVKMRWNAEACVEKARLCWCCDEALVTSCSTSWAPAAPSSPVQPFLSSFALEAMPNHNTVQPLQVNTYPEPEFPAFESQEDLEHHMAPSPSTPSADEDCFTPRDYEDDQFQEENEGGTERLTCDSPLGAGYGVDGEYDDYLEYLKGPVLGHGKGKERSSLAYQLDCRDDRVVDM